jgi:protease-4
MQDTQAPIPHPPSYQPDKKRTRWWIPVSIIGGIILIPAIMFAIFAAFIVGIFAGLESGDTEVKPLTTATVLVVDLSGGLPEYVVTAPFSLGDGPKGPTLFETLDAIERAGTDPNIKGIYIRNGGAGMGMAKLTEVRDALLAFKKSKKFIYAFIDNGTKSQYYLATVADSIFMPQEGLLEFNAFGASAPFMKGLFDKVGVSWHVEQFEEYKSAAETMSRQNWSQPAKEEVRALIEQRQTMFTNAVATSRNIPASKVTALLSRGLYVPDSLLAHGLIDGFARELEVKERIQKRLDPTTKDEHPKLESISINRYLDASDDPTINAEKTIAIVYASGAISDGVNKNPLDPSGIYSKTLIKQLRAAADDEDIEAIVLRIDSPGGSAYASDEIWAVLNEIRKNKPVIASMSDVAASGGYYIAMACDTIVTHPATITGSIGVIMAIPNFAGTASKIGVTVDTVSMGASANFMNPLMPLGDADKAQLRTLGAGIYKRFVSKVAASRKKDFEATRLLARGRVWTGEAALQAGLADVSGGIRTAIAVAKKRIGLTEDEKVDIVSYPKSEDGLQALLSMLNLDNDEESTTEALATAAFRKIRGTEPALESVYNRVPVGLRQQVSYSIMLADVAAQDRALMALPMIYPME